MIIENPRRTTPAGMAPRGSRGTQLPIEKVTWQKAGRVTEPGRYMFRFGWLTVAAEDLAVWNRFPNAAFALVRTAKAGDEDEFRLGAFDVSGEDFSAQEH
jgi:hypothetical protein